VKRSHAADYDVENEVIRRTREVWQPRLDRDLSPDDARRIAANVAGFFTILFEWRRAEMPAPADDGRNLILSKRGGSP